jgi:ribosomal protein L20
MHTLAEGIHKNVGPEETRARQQKTKRLPKCTLKLETSHPRFNQALSSELRSASAALQTRSSKRRGLGELWMKFKPKIGNDFPIPKEVILARARWMTEFTRSMIAISVVLLAILALIITAAFGAYYGDFNQLRDLWAIIAAPLGWIIGYYFRGNSRNDEEDNASAA